jgi:hypothetical protein
MHRNRAAQGVLLSAVVWTLALAPAQAAAERPAEPPSATDRRLATPTPATGLATSQAVPRQSTTPQPEAPRARRSSAMRLTVALGGLALLAIVGLILVKSVTRP